MHLPVATKALLAPNFSVYNSSKYVTVLSSFLNQHSFHSKSNSSTLCLNCCTLNCQGNCQNKTVMRIAKRYKSLSSKNDASNALPLKSWGSFCDFSKRNMLTSDETSSDLKRFLNEVGTDPREARFWLKHFRTVEQQKPFAIFQIDPELFNHPEELKTLTSSLSFLHRNNMRPVIVCGSYVHSEKDISQEEFKELKSKTALDMTVFTSLLEAHGVKARPLFVGSGLIQCNENKKKKYAGQINKINIDLVQWCLHTKHIPVISALGETPTGQIVLLDLWSLTDELSKILEPLKVMKINLTGGLVNENSQVIPNVNLPADLDSCQQKPWFSQDVKHKTLNIYKLLCSMPTETSVVITSVNNILQELFSHRGSGTFFKITEPIHVYKSFDGIDLDRLKDLFNKSFQKDLKGCYFDDVKDKIDRIYLSEHYNAAAIILHDDTNIPYLCKIGVSAKAQGEGTGDMLWQSVTKDFKQLYWRSRIDNVINSWYFKKSEGSWTNGKWTIFWYGVSEPSTSTELINNALHKEQSFQISSENLTA
ncbi:hypothetical protein SNE40_023068 [Patella caerulea]|uniref:N-acetyltransferase domain-containing protein n=1 Tax=Patella caerulea TaxID=87958 RepID=A0AAN8GHC0_PATCE